MKSDKILYFFFGFFCIYSSKLNLVPFALPVIIELLFLIFILYKWHHKSSTMLLILFTWQIICAIRGILEVDGYWTAKYLVASSLILLSPLSICVFTDPESVRKFFNPFIRFIIPLLLLSALITSYDVGILLAPVSFLVIFARKLKIKHQLLLIGISLLCMTIDFGARSVVIKFSVSMLIFITTYTRLLSKKIIRLCGIILLIMPFMFAYLGFCNIFNIFKMDYISSDMTVEKSKNGKSYSEDLKVDTRSGLYKNVMTSSLRNGYYLFGRTPARGNDITVISKYGRVKIHERQSNEVGVLNIYTWTGLVGLLLYFGLFANAFYLGAYRSKNRYIPIIALLVCIYWSLSWIEVIPNYYNDYIVVLIMLGICYSKVFRGYSDREFVNWYRRIFKIKKIRFLP